jgi:hypothetical protein
MNDSLGHKNKLDKKGKITLIISLILASIFIVSGIVVLVLQNRKGFSMDNPIEITETSGYYYNCDDGDVMYYSFSPSSSGYYYINIQGAYVNEVTSDYGYIETADNISEGLYRVHLDRYTTYIIEVITTSDFMRINISK